MVFNFFVSWGCSCARGGPESSFVAVLEVEVVVLRVLELKSDLLGNKTRDKLEAPSIEGVVGGNISGCHWRGSGSVCGQCNIFDC